MPNGLEHGEERAHAENRFTREIHFKNEAFLIGILQAVSGASLVAGLSQLDTLLRLAPGSVVLAFLTIATIALATAVSSAYLKHSYKMWDMKAKAAPEENDRIAYMRLANRDLSLMRGAMTGCLIAILIGYLALAAALWYQYFTDPKWPRPPAAVAPAQVTVPTPTSSASKKP